VTTTVKVPSDIAIAQAASTWSPSITLPSASANKARSASPSCATPASAPFATTASATTSGWSAPQSTLMFAPVGSSLIATTSAPRRASTAGANVDAAPFAQSTTTRMPSRRASAAETTWST